MTTAWLEREALITVKAYPNPSARYQETACVAAITKEGSSTESVSEIPAARRFRPNVF
jgi:hypothetical protein